MGAEFFSLGMILCECHCALIADAIANEENR
jgi:hypothetical protein